MTFSPRILAKIKWLEPFTFFNEKFSCSTVSLYDITAAMLYSEMYDEKMGRLRNWRFEWKKNWIERVNWISGRRIYLKNLKSHDDFQFIFNFGFSDLWLINLRKKQKMIGKKYSKFFVKKIIYWWSVRYASKFCFSVLSFYITLSQFILFIWWWEIISTLT